MLKALLKTAAALCAAAAAAVLTAASTSAYEFEIQKTADGKSYEISDVWSFSEDEGKTVTFPTSQDGHKITGIADNMRIYFAADKVVIPEGYTYLGANTFSYSEIKELSLPASLKTVGEGAVSHNENLTAVNFAMGSNLTTVGADAFQSDPVLKSINLLKAHHYRQRCLLGLRKPFLGGARSFAQIYRRKLLCLFRPEDRRYPVECTEGRRRRILRMPCP